MIAPEVRAAFVEFPEYERPEAGQELCYRFASLAVAELRTAKGVLGEMIDAVERLYADVPQDEVEAMNERLGVALWRAGAALANAKAVLDVEGSA